MTNKKNLCYNIRTLITSARATVSHADMKDEFISSCTGDNSFSITFNDAPSYMALVEFYNFRHLFEWYADYHFCLIEGIVGERRIFLLDDGNRGSYIELLWKTARSFTR